MVVNSRFVWNVARDTVRKLFAANAPFLASGLAFDLLMYSIPLVLLIISVLGYTAIGSDRALAEVQSTIQKLLPDVGPVAVEGLATVVTHRTVLGLAGVVLFIVFSSKTFGSARFALNVLFDTQHHRGFLKGKGIDLLMIGLVSGLFGVTILVNSALGAIRAASDRLPVVGGLLHSWWFTVSEALGLLFVLALFYLLYRVCPAKVLCRPALVAASVTGTGLLEISRWAFGWYVGVAHGTPVLYSALGGFVFYLLWLYYSSLVFLIGAAVGWSIDRHLRIEPSSPDVTFR
jgi:membrane protein